MHILGINAYHPNSSACIIKDGQLLAAVEEERFCRVKHWAGFPQAAIRYCLQAAGIGLEEIDYIALSRNPCVHLHRKFFHVLSSGISLPLIGSRLRNSAAQLNIKKKICLEYGISPHQLKAEIMNIEHHKAHLSSSFLVSGFPQAAILSLDAMGDFVSTALGYGRGNTLAVKKRIFFPHSLGFFYTAVTQFLGFANFNDEYKVMALAGYGKPKFMSQFRKIIQLKSGGSFELDRSYFNLRGLHMLWNNCAPHCGALYAQKWEDLFGEVRVPEGALLERHSDIAASAQGVLEDAYAHLLNYLFERTGEENLCLAGGVTLNCVANGKIIQNTPFKRIYIQPAAGDAGTSIGAAYYVYHNILGFPRSFVMNHAYWGPESSEQEMEMALRENRLNFVKLPEEQLLALVASFLAEGKIIGWFQGRAEWGARALGARSILADPRNCRAKDILNSRVKQRESFRPLAPSILEEFAAEYVNSPQPSSFMQFCAKVREDKLRDIQCATHIDSTARFHTVNRETNPLFWALINQFRVLTGVPALLNTSFNENEPIACRPQEAIGCFLRTPIDALAMGPYVVRKDENTVY